MPNEKEEGWNCLPHPRFVNPKPSDRIKTDVTWSYVPRETGHNAIIAEPQAIADIIATAAIV